ncbi:MAG TPA: hypothetical protein VIC08_09460 [Cellvibrionaceae bacterium]
MSISDTLGLILLQVLFVLTVLCIVLALVIVRLRARARRVMKAYVKLKRLRRTQAARRREQLAEREAELAAATDISWVSLKQETLERYKKLTGKALGDYSREDPFSARIASVRYLYLSGEEQAHRRASGEHQQWQLLERSISALLALIAENTGAIAAANEPDKTALLQQRMQALKAVEKDNAELKAQNQRYGQEVQKLRRYYQRYKELVAQIDSPVTATPPSYTEPLRKIANVHQQRQTLMDDIDRHVQSKPHNAFYQNKQPLMSQLTHLKEGIKRDSASIDHLNDVENVLSNEARFAHLRTLHENNRSQRNTIIELRKELKLLQRAMLEEGPALEASSPGGLPKLERMVMELENCIATLENEVGYLHEKLQAAESSANQEPATVDPVAEVMLGFALAIVSQKTPVDILSLVAATLAQFNMQYALRFSANEAIMYRNASTLNKQEVQIRMDAISHAGSGMDSDGGMAVGGEILQVYVPAGSVELLGEGPLKRLFSLMQNLIGLQLEHLQTVSSVENHHREVEVLAEKVRNGVVKIDMQYAYQTEETRRIVQTLTSEIKQLVDVSDMDSEVSDLFANVINEAEERFRLLYKSGSGVDNEISALSELLDKMK